MAVARATIVTGTGLGGGNSVMWGDRWTRTDWLVCFGLASGAVCGRGIEAAGGGADGATGMLVVLAVGGGGAMGIDRGCDDDAGVGSFATGGGGGTGLGSDCVGDCFEAGGGTAVAECPRCARSRSSAKVRILWSLWSVCDIIY